MNVAISLAPSQWQRRSSSKNHLGDSIDGGIALHLEKQRTAVLLRYGYVPNPKFAFAPYLKEKDER